VIDTGAGGAVAGGSVGSDVGAPEAAFDPALWQSGNATVRRVFFAAGTMLAVEVVITRKTNNKIDPDLWHKTKRTW